MDEPAQNQPEPRPENKEPYKAEYRDLEQDEIELLFILYDKHGGVITQLSKDEESLFHSQAQLYYYEKRYGFQERLVEIRRKRAEQIMASLGEAKIRAIQRAIELLETKERTIVTKKGEVLNIEMDPMYKEIVAAWEIIKTELGEPTSITKSENRTDVSVVEESVDKLNKFINDVKATATEAPSADPKDSPPSS